MDSMRHLSTSLPQARRRNDAPELLADFKAAALSVTNLYKSAAASQSKARDAGYQDALDDLLAFLDRENLGLMDGEGWRVRQWATERLVDDGRAPTEQKLGSDGEGEEEGQGRRHQRGESRSSSPEIQRKAPPMPNSSSEVDESVLETRRNAASELPQSQPPSHENFTFRSAHPYPTDHDREGGMDLDASTTTASTPTPVPTAESTPTNVRLVPRSQGRNRHHHGRRGNNTASTATLNFNLGAGAGSKRKQPYQDFFDISGFNSERPQDAKDGSGGGRGSKRGKHV